MSVSQYLDEKLISYTSSDYYPFHMPGHKRQAFAGWPSPEQIDITEIPGFDNLHHCDGILKEAQERMAALFHTYKSFFLVNGTTCGILASVHAAVRRGDRILIARNCHQAVYHACMLLELRTGYLYPMQTDYGIQGSIDPDDVEQMLSKAREENDPFSAVLITSPTYDGVVSDIKKISDIVHAYGIPLIVDEAHGAHFGFGKKAGKTSNHCASSDLQSSPIAENAALTFPQKAVHLGADYVIESLHKTLPALTQSAVLHIADSAFVNEARLARYLTIFQSSSPSYVLMAGMDRCTRVLSEQGNTLFESFLKRLADFYEQAACLTAIDVMPFGKSTGIFDRDPSRILFRIVRGSKDGASLLNWMHDIHHIDLEMAAGDYATALTSVMDTDEGFARLISALSELDHTLLYKAAIDLKMEEDEPDSFSSDEKNSFRTPTDNDIFQADSKMNEKQKSISPPQKCYELYEAVDLPQNLVEASLAVNRISTAFVSLYPPGIPILIPGERITEDLTKVILQAQAAGIEITGLIDGNFPTAEIIP